MVSPRWFWDMLHVIPYLTNKPASTTSNYTRYFFLRTTFRNFSFLPKLKQTSLQMAKSIVKRVLSDEEDDSQQPIRKISRKLTNGDSDALTSGEQPFIESFCSSLSSWYTGTHPTRKNPDYMEPEGMNLLSIFLYIPFIHTCIRHRSTKTF